MEPVTIIIPTINSAAFIQQTVRYYHSLVSNMPGLSVIIVDDHSTDDTFDIMLKEKKLLNSAIRLIRLKQNYGQLIAYTAGESMTGTDLIIHCDDDVLLSREGLKEFVACYQCLSTPLLYGIVPGKASPSAARGTFYWIVQRVLFPQLADVRISSLRIFSQQAVAKVFDRTIDYRGNMHTPWFFHEKELKDVPIIGGNIVIPHPSRYTMRGLLQHQLFLLLALGRMLAFTLLTLSAAAIYAGMLRASHPFTIFMLVITAGLFIGISVFLKVKSALRFDIDRQG